MRGAHASSQKESGRKRGIAELIFNVVNIVLSNKLQTSILRYSPLEVSPGTSILH